MIYFNSQDENNLDFLDEQIKKLLTDIFTEAMKQNNQDASKLELEFNLISASEMQDLNNRTRGINYATDVLSFPALEDCLSKKINKKNYPYDVNLETGLIYFGEIDINLDKAKEQALEFNHSLNREFCYLFVHAVLHLLGYDHEQEEDKKLMRKYEESILKKFEITRD